MRENGDSVGKKTLHTIEYFGNTSAATIPLALHQGIKQGLLKEGDKVLMYGFGGGFVHGGLLLKWKEPLSKR